jgi:hypothetical protein
MELRLNCHISYIDKYNKIHLLPLDNDTREKLYTHCNINAREFVVSVPKYIHCIDDIRALVGLECAVYVNVQYYNFKSKFHDNQTVAGQRMILSNIVKLRDV